MTGTHSLIGKELGNYLVEALIGEGGMGTVFAAQHRFLGTRVAIKVLHGSYNNNKKITERFFQEARTTSTIDHRSIIKILDFGCTSDGGLYLVMELLTGRSLSDLLANGPIPIAQAADITAKLADGLAAAHRRAVIHRDLKPDNVFLVVGGENQGIKILDFGIAKVLSGSTTNTSTGTILGTPRYMAPEQARGSKQVGPQTDIYSLGVMLFRMVTGQTPFEGDAAELFAQALFAEPPRPSSLAPVPPALEELILQCLAKNPADRPATMIEVRDRLQPWVSGAPLQLALDVTAPVKLPRSTLTDSVGEVIPPRAAARPRSRVALFAAAAVAVVSLGGAAVMHWWPAHLTAVSLPPQPVKATPAPTPAPSPAPGAQVAIKTVPSGADLLLDGKVVGQSPLTLTLALPATIEARQAGHEPARGVVTVAGEVVLVLAPSTAPVPAASPVTPPARSNAVKRARPKTTTPAPVKENFYVE